MCHMGPKVFINCAGFIKIDTASLGDRLVPCQRAVTHSPSAKSTAVKPVICHLACQEVILNRHCFPLHTHTHTYSTDSYIEVLDGSRVHPETYEWARKMAVDALEYDESAEDANPAGALEEILENPERLKDLDLDAFAEELERQVSF